VIKTVGYVLITIGFLAGALVAVQTAENHVSLTYFVPAFLAGVLGVVLARIGIRQASRDAGSLKANMVNIDTSLERIVTNIRRLDGEKQSINAYDFHGKIDELFPDDLLTFVEARESIGHIHGLAAYAAVMNEFAAGERYLNRVWSSSIDGYIDEIHEYLPRSAEQFVEAQRKLRSYTSS